MPGSEILVQLSKSYTEYARFMDLNALLHALSGDFAIPEEHRPQALQTIYVCTGCDYISFFQGIGKASFLTSFFRFASFITDVSLLGSLGKVSPDPNLSSFYSFLRLVGCAYFKAHLSAFQQQSPVTLFHSVKDTSVSIETKHQKWLEIIRRTVWQRADTENRTMPSTEALKLHWLRVQWVLKMWHQATTNDIDLPGVYMYIYTDR